MNKCYWCGGVPSNGIGDHYFPKTVGGKTGDNLFHCCKSCNSAKGNRFWEKKDNKIIKYKKEETRVKKVSTEKYDAVIVSNIFYIRKPYKKLKNEFEEYGELITKTVQRIRVKKPE